MKRNLKQIREEMEKREFKITSTQEALLGGIMLAMEDLEEELKKKK